MDELEGLTQKQYEQLMSRLAGAMQTQRRFITLVGAERVSAVVTRYKVKRQGEYYPYLIEETFTRVGNIYLNLGVLI